MWPRRSLTRPAIVTFTGLVTFALGSLLTLVLDYLAFGLFVPAALVIGVLLLGAAAVVATGARWAPPVGAAVAAVVLMGTFTFGVGLRRLAAPENVALFASTVLMVGGGAVAVTAGFVASYRQLVRRTAVRN